jgi:hypothetical protein
MNVLRATLRNSLLRPRSFAAHTALVAALAACGSAGDPSGSSGIAPQPAGDRDAAPQGDPPDGAAPPEAGLPPPPAEPDIDAIPWETGASIGNGVAHKDTQNPLGDSAALLYAGFGVDLGGARSWATALYRAELRARGVRQLWAVQGPNLVEYQNQEIGNSKVGELLVSKVSATTKFVLVLGHSSGSFVAHELLGQLAGGLDPGNVTAGKVVYFDLDGGQSGLSAPIVARLRKAYFVSPRDKANGTPGFNNATMQSLGTTYAGAGGFFEVDASASGCNAGANACVHVSLVNAHPHDPSTALLGVDYGMFDAAHPVGVAYLTMKSTEAGIVK